MIVRNNFSPFFNRAATRELSPTLVSPIPTPTQNDEVWSPDGKVTLIMQTKTETDGSVTYSFFTQTTDGGNNRLIFTASGMKGEFALSPNAWSPDNAYFFLKQTKNELFNALVFKATEGSDSYMTELRSIFEKQERDHFMSDVTGWDSPTLMHIKTQKKDEMKKGPSYWFDITGNSFIQL